MNFNNAYKMVGAVASFSIMGPVHVIMTDSTPTERVLALVVTVYLIVTVVFMLGLLLSEDDDTS